MPQARAYLDHNASTPLRPAAAEAFARALELVGNPSSVHAEGRAARAALDRARHQVAAAVGGEARNVIFTSGATEALNTLLRPAPAAKQLFVLATEHSAALAGGGFEPDAITTIPVGADGIADRRWLEAALSASDAPAMVALQAANSETGVIQPVIEMAEAVRSHGAALVCDAVAAIGKIPLDIKALKADALVISAHKFGGPKGVGAMILNGERLRMEPLLKGGGQEMRRRSGTENVAGIAAMGAAIEAATADIGGEGRRLAALRDRMLARFRAIRPDLVVFGETAPRLSNTLCLAAPGMKAETAVIAFDLAGVAVSSGSACSSGKVKRSHVLDAMGVDPPLAEGALRFSLGWTTKEADIDLAVRAFETLVGTAAARAA